MQPLPPSPASEVAAPRLLVVDDEPSVRRVCAFTLRAEGWCVEAEADARAALARLAGGGRFDALVLDYAMPGLDGLELLRELERCLGPGGVPPVILASAHADGAVAAAALRLGVWDFLAKPLTPEDLRRRVRSLLGRAADCAAGSGLACALLHAGRREWDEARGALGVGANVERNGNEAKMLVAGLLAEIAGDVPEAAHHFRAAHWPVDWRWRGPEVWVDLAHRLADV
jgi:two-component system, chemotaxis family, chemotaxis protein CheY